MAKAQSGYQFGNMGLYVKRRLSNDNDAKIIVQGQDSETGIGKTTFAIRLCRHIDPDWNAEEKSFVDVREYINAHMEVGPGSALLLDEIEAGADSRRAMSQENVDLSQAWATLRSRNVVTVCTLPTISMLDNRLLELSDFWVLVKKRGLAQPYKVSVNDFNHKVQRKELGGGEMIQYKDLPDGDPDKRYLDEMKDEMLLSEGAGYVKESECAERVEKAKREAVREYRNEILTDIKTEFDVTYRELAALESVDVQHNTISEIVKKNS